MKPHYFGKLKKVNGQLIYIKPGDEKIYQMFKDSLEEGAIIEIFVEEFDNSNTIPQLRKCHAMIRELSDHSGFSFQECKLLVKDKAGLCITRTISGKEYYECKSFADASSDELSAAIQACIELGEQMGTNIT